MEKTMIPLAVMMNRDIKKISPDAKIRELAQLMRDKKIGSALVAQADDYIGIVSETDLVRKGLAEGLNPEQATVRQVMSSPIITIDIGRTVADANDLMAKRGIRHLPITELGKIVGIISVRDLVICYKNKF
jgi:CBS domain-containing protein